ncbi:MAG TPA: hypothetical protein DIC49_05630, partial [Gammaproteobacteria bacterium]|nr:hypothetical protein [Gammaproteobacteria bacterium]
GHVISSNGRLLHAVDWIPVLLVSTLPVALLSLLNGLKLSFDDFVSDREEAVRDMLRFSFCALIVFFVIKGLFGKVLFNWPLPLIPMLLMIFGRHMRWSALGTLAAGVVQLALLCILIYPYAVGLSMKHDPIQKLRGWDRVVAEAAKLAGPTDVVTTDHYSIQAWALYHWPSDSTGLDRYTSPTGQVVPNETRRQNQYDNWDVLDSPKPSLVHIGRYSEDLAMRCSAFKELGDVSQVMPDGTVRETIKVFRCDGFSPQPAWPKMDQY